MNGGSVTSTVLLHLESSLFNGETHLPHALIERVTVFSESKFWF